MCCYVICCYVFLLRNMLPLCWPWLSKVPEVGLQVVDVYFPKDRATNRRKNFCFVTFATQQVNGYALPVGLRGTAREQCTTCVVEL